MANNATFSLGASGNASNGVAVTAGATLFNPPLARLWVGGAGNITITMPGTGTGLVLNAVPAGTMLQGISILAVTASTATGLVGFY